MTEKILGKLKIVIFSDVISFKIFFWVKILFTITKFPDHVSIKLSNVQQNMNYN